MEICAFKGSEPAKAVLERTAPSAFTSERSQRVRAIATAYAQFVAGPLGLDYEKIRVVQGDSDALPAGGGTGGSRSIPLGVPSVDRASRMLADQIKALAADELEAGIGDIELVDGAARVVGTDRGLSYAEIAERAKDKTKLIAIGEFNSEEQTYPNGTHVCEVEIDPETGHTEVVRYTIVDDFGATVNPMLLAGQVHGGVAQSIGQALLEHTVYDADGQLDHRARSTTTRCRAPTISHLRFPDPQHALQMESARHQGRGRGRHDRRNAGGDERGRRCAQSRLRHPQHRYAGDAARIWEAIQAAKA